MSDVLLSDDLFNQVLLNPAIQGADELFIVSGYASAVMASYHIEQLKKQRIDLKINLIVGMTSRDGLSLTNHQTFKNLMENEFPGDFTCSYLTDHPPVHSKVYSWFQNGNPIDGYLGSANYSQQAFVRNSQKEVATKCDPENAFNYYQSLIGNSIYCNHQEVEEQIVFYNSNRASNSNRDIIEEENSPYEVPLGLDYLDISLLQTNGEIHQASGLNWGQRAGRERNQAYIPLQAEVWRSDFFPSIGQHFTVRTDDRKILLFTRAQQNGKALHTPLNNSHMGEYFRSRLGVANGDFVTKDDLLEYGRTTVRFYKTDEEEYQMDFSV